MTFRILITSKESDDFVREVRIDADASFLALRDVVAQACEYENSQLTCFYVTPEGSASRVQIALNEMPLGENEDDAYIMEQTTLRDFLTYKGQQFSYVFDTFNERKLHLKVVEMEPKACLKRPKITRAEGRAPQELLVLGSSGAVAEGSNLVVDDDFGIEGFDQEDIDFGGFGISEE